MLSLAARVALVACSLALDVFAVSVGVGMRGLNIMGRLRIGAAFATAEVGMNLIGAALGAAVGRMIGDTAGYLGFAALIGVGVYMLVEELRQRESGLDLSRGWGLLLASLSISLDSLGVGFSIAYLGVPMAVTLGAIAVASILATTLGLAFGEALGGRAQRWAGLLGGVALIGTGVLFAVLKYTGHG
jgi:putative Mn2+ efflux pump MntP